MNGQEILAVASLHDGVWLIDVTIPMLPVTLAHVGYTWETPDVNGDGVPDFCDVFGSGTPASFDMDSIPDNVIENVSHDARITDDSLFLWTADEQRCHGPVLVWDLNEILTTCSDADFCAMDEISPIGEFRTPPIASAADPNLLAPISPHQVRFLGNFAVMSWYEEGLRIADFSNGNEAAPVEVGFFDTLVPNTDGCFENGVPPVDCTSALGNRIHNRGVFGAWGVAFDDCYFYLSERGSSDNIAAPGIVGTEGSLIVLRYTGGPTTPQPLRITKDLTSAGDLVASWGDVPLATQFNLYRGTIASLFFTHAYDHTMLSVSTCSVAGPSQPLVNQFVPDTPGTNFYCLVTSRSPCDDAADREGNYGVDSFGQRRPVAISTCPL